MNQTITQHNTANSSASQPMEHILVPMDFSMSSENSLAYAVGIAQTTQKCVIMCRFISSTVPVGANATLHKRDLEEQYNNAYMQMRILLSQYANNTYQDTAQPVLIEPLVMQGNPEDAMLKILEDNSIAMVVLSHKDSSEIQDLFLKSPLIRDANCPVLTVPATKGYQPFTHIVYATNFDGNDNKRINELIELAKMYNAKLDCLHVCTDGKKLREENEKMQALQTEFEIMPYSKISFKVVRDDKSVSSGLESYVMKHNPDMLVMLRHEQTFFKRLFSKSTLRQTVLDYGTPLMIYRETK